MHTSAHDPQVLHFLRDLPYNISNSDDVRGKAIHGPTGQLIGHVHELVVSHDGSQVVFLEVEHRTLMSLRKYLVPVEDVMVKANGELYVKGDGPCTDATPWNCPPLQSSVPVMTAGD